MKHIKRNIVRSLRFNWNDSEARVLLEKVIKICRKISNGRSLVEGTLFESINVFLYPKFDRRSNESALIFQAFFKYE